MNRFAVLCGAATDGFRQKKLVEIYDSLISGKNAVPPANIVIFPNGVHELLFEGTFSRILDEEPDEILVYFFALNDTDLNALSEYEATGFGKIPLIRLGRDEIRREVISYYEDLAKDMGIALSVAYFSDRSFVSEGELGYEEIGSGMGFKES